MLFRSLLSLALCGTLALPIQSFAHRSKRPHSDDDGDDVVEVQRVTKSRKLSIDQSAGEIIEAESEDLFPEGKITRDALKEISWMMHSIEESDRLRLPEVVARLLALRETAGPEQWNNSTFLKGMLLLADMLDNGASGVPQPFLSKSILKQLYSQTAVPGVRIAAMYRMKNIISRQDTEDYDAALTRSLAEELSMQDHSRVLKLKSMKTLSWLLINGIGGRSDHRQARSILEQLIDQDLLPEIGVRSKFMFAQMLMHGQGGDADPQRARALYEELAEQESSLLTQKQARLNLSVELHQGAGGPKDFSRAREIFQSLCNQDEPANIGVLAKFNLAGMFLRGEGGATNYIQARQMYEELFNQDKIIHRLPDAKLNLAHMLQMGYGGPKDLARAQKILRSLCKEGFPKSIRTTAQRKLKKLSTHATRAQALRTKIRKRSKDNGSHPNQ